MNSCEGLLCLVDTLGKIVLWNPSPRQCNPLPPNPNAPKYIGYGPNPSTTKYIWYGFGNDSSTDDYKIVGVSSLGYETMVDVFSLKFYKWRRIQEKHHTKLICSWRDTILHGGSALDSFYDPNEDHYLTIVAFDFQKEEFQRMAFPRDESNYGVDCCRWMSLCALW